MDGLTDGIVDKNKEIQIVKISHVQLKFNYFAQQIWLNEFDALQFSLFFQLNNI